MAKRGRLTAAARTADAASPWGGASAVDMAAQFEQERRAHRLGIGALLAPADLAAKPAHSAASALTPQPERAANPAGSDLGAWLRALGAGEFEGAFRDQQFETVEELVEARCAAARVSADCLAVCTGLTRARPFAG